MIKHGTLLNKKVTTNDVACADKIWGRDIAALKGKTTRKSPMQSGGTEKIEVTVRQDQNLYTDIMFVEGAPFFVSVAQPLDLIQVTDLKGKGYATILHQAFEEHKGNLESKGYNIQDVFTDGEAGIEAIKDCINKSVRGRYNPTGPEQHVPVVERAIRTVKERTRSILCGLPYELPGSLLGYLASFAVRAINMIPSHDATGNLSPREKLIGLKTDVERDLRVEFGQCVQARVPTRFPILCLTVRKDVSGYLRKIPQRNKFSKSQHSP